MSLNVLFAGGGTGGHVAPAVAVARSLQKLVPGSRVLFLGTGRPVEERILSGAGIPRRALAAAPASRSLSGLPRFLFSQARGLAQALLAVRSFRPDVTVGLGGYASAAGVVASRLMNVPVALLEPNAVPGRATQVLSRVAAEVFVHWEEGGRGLGAPVVVTGTPINRSARASSRISKEEARRRLGLPVHRSCLLIVGGSQGARALNRWALESLAGRSIGDDVSVVHVTGGEADALALRAAYDAAGMPRCVTPFFDEMGLAYRAADLAVCRGGAATLAEACAEGLPSIVVPLPTSALDHQRANARALAAQGAGRLVEEATLTPGRFLEVLALASSPAALAPLREAALAAGRPAAAEALARRLVSLSGISLPIADKESGRSAGRRRDLATTTTAVHRPRRADAA